MLKTPEFKYPNWADRMIAARVRTATPLLKTKIPDEEIARVDTLEQIVSTWVTGESEYVRNPELLKDSGDGLYISNARVTWAQPETEGAKQPHLLFKATANRISDDDLTQILHVFRQEKTNETTMNDTLRSVLRTRRVASGMGPELRVQVSAQSPEQTQLAGIAFIWRPNTGNPSVKGSVDRRHYDLDVSPAIPLLDLILMRRRVIAMAKQP